MQLQGDLIIGRQTYVKGTDVPWYKLYPLFLLHMLIMGGSGFAMAYAGAHPPVVFLYLHGGFAIAIYTLLYLKMFGRDEVKWMFLNAALGVAGISSQIDWLLGWFGRRFADYPWYIHVIPFVYWVLYTFLLRHAVLDLTRSRSDPVRQRRAEAAYVALSVIVYVGSWYGHTRR